jgi:hypothetical protein
LPFYVLTGAWNIEFQTLPVMSLIEVEPGGGAVEADLFTDLLLEV